MIDQTFILIILNCKKYKSKAEIQKKHWLNNLNANISYFHIIGDKEKCGTNDYLFDNLNNILYVNTEDDYLSLPHKVISAIDAINKTYNYKYILKTDDDQMLINENYFNTTLSVLCKKEFDYGGFLVNVPDHISKYWMVHDCLPRNLFLKGTQYCNGRFYILSNKIVNILITKKESIKKYIIEDHCIGLHIPEEYKKNILKFNNNLIFIDMEKYFNK
jgi:hypothetical protein